MTAIGLDFEIGEGGLRIVVCPKRALDVWRRHLEWMGQDVTILDPTDRSSFERELMFHKTTSERKWFVLHWDVVSKLQPTLVRVRPKHVIGDEVHRAKNRDAQRTKAFKKIKGEYRTGLTGTPCDKPDELWSILHWLWPKRFTSYWRFMDAYVDWYENTQGYKVICGVLDGVEELWEEMEPWFVRRKLADVAEFLPTVRREVQYVDLTSEQRRVYDDLEQTGISQNGDGEFTVASNPAVLRTRLQQSAVATPTKNGRLIEPSSKLDALMDLFGEMDRRTPLVVFTEYRDVVDLVVARLQGEGIKASSVKGGDQDSDRAIHRFQEGETQVFVATVRAANEGIDLSRANIVVMLDLDPAVGANDQAEARIMGLNSTHCTVIEIRATGTVDDHRADKISRKRQWTNQILGVG